MSSLTQKYTVCASCRDVDCSVAVRCDECREWSTDAMNDYVRHKRSLISKSRKPKITTPSVSTPSVTPSESPPVSQVATPSLTSIADDEKLKSYVQSFLASMLNQSSGQVSLGSNPFISAPSVEVPDLPPQGSTGGKIAESLSSRSVESPSGVVPPSPQEDVMPPTHVSVSNVSSVGLAGVSRVPSPSLGVSAPVSGRGDQLRDRGDLGFTRHVVSADIHHVPRSVSSFDLSSLLFPFSDSSFASLSSSVPLPLCSFSASLFLLFGGSDSLSCPSCFCACLFSSVCCAFRAYGSSLFCSFSYPFVFFLYRSSSGFLFFCLLPLLFTALFRSLFSSWSFGCSFVFCSFRLLVFSSFFCFIFCAFFFDFRPVSSPSLDFAAYQANVLGLSAEYQALGRWYFVSGGNDFPRLSIRSFSSPLLGLSS